MIILVCLTKTWKIFSVPLLLFIGCKLNAIFFYHYMEFTHLTLAPKNLIPYFGVEGPYIISMMIIAIMIH